VIPRFTLPLRDRKLLLIISLAASCTGGPAVSAQPALLEQASDIDWVRLEDLSAEQRTILQDQLPANCCGLYLQPELPAIEGETGSANVSADTIEGESGKQLSLKGNIEILQNNMSLQADSGIYDSENGDAVLQGNIRVRQPGLLLVGSDGTVDNEGTTTNIRNASYVLHEDNIRGSAEIIVYTDADGIITIDNGLFTRCEPGDNSWVVEAGNIVLNQTTGRGWQEMSKCVWAMSRLSICLVLPFQLMMKGPADFWRQPSALPVTAVWMLLRPIISTWRLITMPP
jgi:lipopolysaccharide assembly outer membrane protein LptD (OstA)